MKTQAIKEVATFWLLVSVVMGFAILVAHLAMRFGAIGFGIPMGLFIFVAFSFMIYSTSEAHDKKTKVRRKARVKSK